MLNENIKILSEIANEILASGNEIEDIDRNKGEILLPFFEEVLGYDTIAVGDIVVAPAYNDNLYKLDYGLRGNTPNTYKSCFKVVARGENFEDHYNDIKLCLALAETEFIVITDCFDFRFLVYDNSSNQLMAIGDYSLINPADYDQSLLTLIHCPENKPPKQEYALRDDDDDDIPFAKGVSIFEEEDEEPAPPKKKKPVQPVKQKTDKKIFIIGGIIIAILIALIVFLFASKDSDGGFFSNLPIIGSQSGIEKGQLDGSLTLEVTGESTLKMKLYSRNIPQGGVIKFQITSGINQDAVYGSIGADGNAYAEFVIPGFWDEPNISIIASLRFDEANYAQPANVKQKFGEIGEEIIGKDGAPDKFAITFGNVTHDSQAIRDKLLAEQLEAEKKARQERLALLGKLNIRVDTVGNWKILPYKYNMNEANITKSINIYPQVFYNAKENRPYFYLVVGDMKGNPIMFTDVIFYADGYQWAYETPNDTKEVSVNNGVWKEWAYLNNEDMPDLYEKAKLLASSETSKITFKGNQIVEHVLSADEKQNIITMAAAYDKYFNTGSAPKSEWYIEYMEAKTGTSQNENGGDNSSDGNNTSIALSYIKKPDGMLERAAGYELELANYLKKIQDKRLKGETISSTEESTLDYYLYRYHVVPDYLASQIHTELAKTTATLSKGQDFETMENGYYKIYFNYNTSGSIENGYISHIYVMSDQTVYVPVKSSIAEDEAGYAIFKMSNTTFNDLVRFVATTDFEIIK